MLDVTGIAVNLFKEHISRIARYIAMNYFQGEYIHDKNNKQVFRKK